MLLACVLLPWRPATAQKDSYNGQRFTIAGAPAETNPPTPPQYNYLWVRKYGPRSAQHVLILVPGSPAGQANYDLLAPELVQRVPNLAVWTIDRRENGFEDTSAFELKDPGYALCYYLLFSCGNFAPVLDDEVPFVREWGAAVEIDDLHQVVEAARDGGRRGVILGGHSAGAVLVPTYAAWDFAGEPGYRELEAMVLIDGGQFGAFSKVLEGTPFEKPWQNVHQARRALRRLDRHEDPFPYYFGYAGTQAPFLWAVGVGAELGCQYALLQKDQPSVFQLAVDAGRLVGLIPKWMRDAIPTFPITNEAFMGRLFTSPSSEVIALHSRVGRLAGPDAGSPRPWRNGPYASVHRACETIAHEPGNGLEWYYPVRYDMDLLLALNSLTVTPVTEALGLRPYHLQEIDIPLYVFETGLSQGGVLKAARTLIAQSQIPPSEADLQSDRNMGHFDPLVDKPHRNKFIRTVVPFLAKITGGSPH